MTKAWSDNWRTEWGIERAAAHDDAVRAEHEFRVRLERRKIFELSVTEADQTDPETLRALWDAADQEARNASY